MSESMNARTPAYWGDCVIDLAIGIVVLLAQPRWMSWGLSRVFHTPFDEFYDENHVVVPYPHVPEFWSDLGPTLFGVLLIVASLLMCIRRRWAIAGALGLTAVSTLYNVGYIVASYRTYGLPLISALAAIFGGFLLTRQWQMLTRASLTS